MVGKALLNTVSHRLAAAFTTFPGPDQWALAGLLLLLFGLIACPVGLKSGFLRAEVIASRWTLGGLAGVTLVSPAIVEEAIYRIALLPHPSEGRPLAAVVGWAAVGLLVFVASHLINLSRRGSARAKTCRHPVFLALAALLGVVCTQKPARDTKQNWCLVDPSKPAPTARCTPEEPAQAQTEAQPYHPYVQETQPDDNSAPT